MIKTKSYWNSIFLWKSNICYRNKTNNTESGNIWKCITNKLLLILFVSLHYIGTYRETTPFQHIYPLSDQLQTHTEQRKKCQKYLISLTIFIVWGFRSREFIRNASVFILSTVTYDATCACDYTPQYRIYSTSVDHALLVWWCVWLCARPSGVHVWLNIVTAIYDIDDYMDRSVTVRHHHTNRETEKLNRLWGDRC